MRNILHLVLSTLALALLPLMAHALSVGMDAQPVRSLELFGSNVTQPVVAVNAQADLSGFVAADASRNLSMFREDHLSEFVNTSFSAVPILAFLYLFGFGLISLAGLSRRRRGEQRSSGQDVL